MWWQLFFNPLQLFSNFPILPCFGACSLLSHTNTFLGLLLSLSITQLDCQKHPTVTKQVSQVLLARPREFSHLLQFWSLQLQQTRLMLCSSSLYLAANLLNAKYMLFLSSPFTPGLCSPTATTSPRSRAKASLQTCFELNIHNIYCTKIDPFWWEVASWIDDFSDLPRSAQYEQPIEYKALITALKNSRLLHCSESEHRIRCCLLCWMVALCPDAYANTSTTEDEQGHLQAYTGVVKKWNIAFWIWNLLLTRRKLPHVCRTGPGSCWTEQKNKFCCLIFQFNIIWAIPVL